MTPQMTQLLIIFLGVVIALLIGSFFLAIIFIKFTAKGKVVAIFFEERRVYSMLVVEDSINQCIWRGAEDNPNREKYKLVPEKVFEITWPAGMPAIMQERLRAWLFTRNNEEPYDPSNMRMVMSARMSRMISDEALLRTMWKDLRAATGLKDGGGKLPMTMVLFLAFIALLSGIGMIMTYNVGHKIDQEYALLKHIYDMLVAAKLIQP